MEGSVPVDVGNWLLALTPIVLLLLLMAVFRWKAPEAGPLGMFLAVAVAMIFFRTPWETTAVGVGMGLWDAIFILLVIWPALLLYQVGVAAGAFEGLRRGLSRYSRNHVFLVLAFGWVFVTFVQGVAGFGAPIAIVAPLLLAIGVRPVYAVVIPLIGHAWASMFGTLGIGWLALLQVVDMEDELGTALATAALLAPVTFLSGVTIAWMAGKWAALRLAWPFILIIAVIHGGLQYVIMYWEPLLSNFLAGTVALIALYPLSRWSRFSEPARDVEEAPAMRDKESREESEEEKEDEAESSVMSLSWALLPYAVLTLISVLTLAVDPIEEFLDQFEFGPPFPEVSTGYDIVTEGAGSYDPIAPLTHPGFALLIAVVISWYAFRRKGFFETEAKRSGRTPIWPGLVGNATPASVAIMSFLVLASVMEVSGQTELLAAGIDEVLPPMVSAFASVYIAILGAFLTSSSTSANIVFGQLQQDIGVGAGLNPTGFLAAQGAGSSLGNVFAPANVVLGTGTAGIVGQEHKVLRKTIPWTLAVGALVGALTLLYV
ncbi:L-lactate permease [Streptomyces albidoflavus]